jgi:hypothetical protein
MPESCGRKGEESDGIMAPMLLAGTGDRSPVGPLETPKK